MSRTRHRNLSDYESYVGNIRRRQNKSPSSDQAEEEELKFIMAVRTINKDEAEEMFPKDTGQ